MFRKEVLFDRGVELSAGVGLARCRENAQTDKLRASAKNRYQGTPRHIGGGGTPLLSGEWFGSVQRALVREDEFADSVFVKLVEPVDVVPGCQCDTRLHVRIGRHQHLQIGAGALKDDSRKIIYERVASIRAAVVDAYPSMLQIVYQVLVGDEVNVDTPFDGS